ncbi:MAG: hypothetical protein AAFQ94_22265 [Bacteroidota bacterium]
MRKIILSLFVAVICFSCAEDDESVSGDTRFYVPQLTFERRNLIVELNFIDPRPFTSYLGGPPSTSDVIDVYLSTDNENFTILKNVDLSITRLTVGGFSSGMQLLKSINYSSKSS